ncbi:response regulator, partial [Patescibacteria group bacterium]|nr:response regulator [Patescibacteria group bacterium]
KERRVGSKNLEDLKIVIISNLGQRSEVEKGLKLGAVKYLVKSHYTPSQIVEEVKQILGV